MRTPTLPLRRDGSTPTKRLAIVGATLLLASALLFTGLAYLTAGPAAAASVDGGFEVANVNESVDGEVSDLRLTADADYGWTADHADMATVQLVVGESRESATPVDYVTVRDPSRDGSGTESFDVSIFDSDDFSRADFQPAEGEEVSREVVVGVIVEVDTAYGETERATAYDTVTVDLADDVTLEADAGGSGTITVETTT